MRKLSTAEFIQQAKNVHGITFNYDEVIYVGSSSPVRISCSQHGVFEQRPNDHVLKKRGCPKCGKLSAGDKRRKNPKQFIKDAKTIHGSKYTYDKVIYQGTHTPVIITCPKHGDFEQKPNAHLSQQNGCSKCGYARHPGRYMPWHFKTQEQKNQPGIFYVLQFKKGREKFIKIGITSTSVCQRYSGKKKGYDITILCEEQTTLFKAYQREAKLKQALLQYQYTPKRMSEGHTECYVASSGCLAVIG